MRNRQPSPTHQVRLLLVLHASLVRRRTLLTLRNLREQEALVLLPLGQALPLLLHLVGTGLHDLRLQPGFFRLRLLPLHAHAAQAVRQLPLAVRDHLLHQRVPRALLFLPLGQARGPHGLLGGGVEVLALRVAGREGVALGGEVGAVCGDLLLPLPLAAGEGGLLLLRLAEVFVEDGEVKVEGLLCLGGAVGELGLVGGVEGEAGGLLLAQASLAGALLVDGVVGKGGLLFGVGVRCTWVCCGMVS